MTLPAVAPVLDVDRVVTYNPVIYTETFNITFPIFGDNTDIQVWYNGTKLVEPAYSVASLSGTFSLQPRPVTDAYIQFPTGQGKSSGTLVIIGATHPRRVTQATSALTTRDFNLSFSGIIASLRELFSASARSPKAPPGETGELILPKLADRLNMVMGFDSAGNPTAVLPTSPTLLVASLAEALAGTDNTKVMTPSRVLSVLQQRFYSVVDFGVLLNSGADQSSLIQSAINAVYAAGGGILFFPAATYFCENIEIKNNVWLAGEGMQFTRLKLKASSTADLLYTTGAYNLFGTGNLSSGPDVAPYRWGIFNMTLDGNASANTSNPKGRGIYSWSIGMTIENVQILNCRRHGWCQGAPVNWAYYNPDWTGEARVRNITIQRCNQAKDPDVVNGVGGGGLYWGGPTDARFFETFIGWCEGGYSLKIGSTGNARFIGGEFWGGGFSDNVNVSSITRSGTTATVTTSAAHGLATGELVTIYGAVQTAYNITATITVTSSTTFTYQVSGSPTTPATGTIVANKIYFPQWAVISENLNGFTGTDINLSGGYSGQALIRKNGFRHSCKHNYLVAGDGVTATIIQKGYQIGDSANGFTNVAGVYIDALHEDILGATVDFNSSGGFNRINIRGYANYSGMATDIAGTPNAIDEYDIRISGATTVNRFATPFDSWTSYTPTITSSAGSGLTTGSVSGRYKRIGKTVWLEVKFTITAMGTASGLINVTLPSGQLPAAYAAFIGREDINSGKAVVGAARTGVSTFEATYYDYTFPGTVNSVIYISGCYEAS